MLDNNAFVFENVFYSYGNQEVLTSVDLQIGRNELVWIVGPNGGGKTTLVKLLVGLLQPERGTIKVLGRDPLHARYGIGYMPQHSHFDSHFPITVEEVVLTGLSDRNTSFGRYRKSHRVKAIKALNQVGLGAVSSARLNELSGGQQRRVMIARALASEPELLVLDEPTANLDMRVEKELNQLLLELSNSVTVVMVSHDPAFVSGAVQNVICVSRTVAVHPTTEVNHDFLTNMYGNDVRIVQHDRQGEDHHHE